MDRTDYILKLVAETLLMEESQFHVTLLADGLGLPLEGVQRLVLGGRATPALEIGDGGIAVSLSINHVHYNIHIPWGCVISVEGRRKAFFCKRETPTADGETEKAGDPPPRRHLKVVK